MNKLILIFLFPILVNGQLIDNRKCEAFSDNPFFYTSFIAENKIKSITGNISTKKNLQVIQQKGKITKYEFNGDGNLVKQIGSFSPGTRRDTSFIDYIYDSKGRVITKRTSDSYGFFSYNFNYNDAGQLIEKKYCRDENAGKSRYNFVLKKQYVIVKEGYSYEVKDTFTVKSVLNNHGRVYQKETFSYNELNLLEKIIKKLIVNHKRSETTFKYNDLGLVAEKKIQPDATKSKFTRFTYEYDEFGNLEFIDEYTNDKKITHKEVIYNKSTLLMKALLIQDIETNFIKIIKFKYEFYD